MDNDIIVTVLVFFSAFLLVMGAYLFLRSNAERRALLTKIQHEGTPEPSEHQAPQATLPSRLFASLARFSLWLGTMVKPKDENEISRSRLLFLRAGYKHRNMPVIFMGARLLLAPLLPLLFYIGQTLSFHMPSSHAFLIGCALFAIGYLIPGIYLNMKIARRKEKITEGFPDALDLLVVCVEAGMGLDSAINRVAIEMETTNKPISDEFKTLNNELRAGRARRDALKSLSTRTDLDDVNSLVTLIIQTDKFGTSVGPALRVHSDAMRTKRYQRAEERAAKIPTKLVFPLLLFIFPSMFIIFLAPPIIQLVRMWKGGMGG